MKNTCFTSNTKVTYGFSSLCYRIRDVIPCLGCYAMKAYRLYPSCRQAWEKNLYVSKQELCREIAHDNPKYIRIFSSCGEYEKQEDVTFWEDIAKQFPETTFYGFSKSAWLDFSNNPQNMIIRVNPHLNYDKEEIIRSVCLSNPKKFYLCPCTKKSPKKCMVNCFLCITMPKNKLPLFIKH